MPEDAKGVYQVGRKACRAERVLVRTDREYRSIQRRDSPGCAAPDARAERRGNVYRLAMAPLHSRGRRLACPAACWSAPVVLACPVIYATGFLMWWRKRRGRATAGCAVVIAVLWPTSARIVLLEERRHSWPFHGGGSCPFINHLIVLESANPAFTMPIWTGWRFVVPPCGPRLPVGAGGSGGRWPFRWRRPDWPGAAPWLRPDQRV